MWSTNAGYRMSEPPNNDRSRIRTRMNRWSTPPSDATFRMSMLYDQSPHCTNKRHTLDFVALREYGSVCLSKLSRSRKRMSFNNRNSYKFQEYEMSSPVSAQSSPRLFPLVPMVDHRIQRVSTEYFPEAEPEDDHAEGVQAVRSDIEPIIHTLFESSTGRYQYLVADPNTKDAIIIDPVLDKNPHGPGIITTAADQILYLVRLHKYHVVRILETHSIQEHPTSAWYLRSQLRDSNDQMPRICTGKAIAGVQRMFARQYQVHDAGWASRFDFFRDGQIFVVGEMKVQCIHLLSQPDWFGFIIGHNIFLGKEVPKDMTESVAVRPTQQIPMRKLAQFVRGYAFHPQNTDETSRPSTAQTDVSQWMHDALLPRHESMAPHEAVAARHDSVSPRSPRSPRGSSGMARMRRIMGRQNTTEDWSSVSSIDSSRNVSRRISQIPELA